MKDATHKLRDDVEVNESRSHWAAWIIVIGLLIEVAVALSYPSGRTALENWAPVLTNIMIALGVYGEIHFSGKASRSQKRLQSIADEKLADALNRASRAEQELIDFRKPRRSLMTRENTQLIIEKLLPFART
jgi:hypothetical protein